MSVSVMSLVFKAKLSDLDYTKDKEARKAKASTCKLLLLAYADHSNDEGEAAYPGYDKLEIKTALSRQGIADTLEALRQNELLIYDGKSKLETNAYHINLDALNELVKPLDSDKKDESSHLTRTSQATGLEGVKPLDLNHPLTIPQPSSQLTPDEGLNLDYFTARFGKLTSRAELDRVLALFRANGRDRMLEIFTWAEKQQIHLSNRSGLVGSLETAAARWTGKATRKPKGDRADFMKQLETA